MSPGIRGSLRALNAGAPLRFLSLEEGKQLIVKGAVGKDVAQKMEKLAKKVEG